MESLNPLVTIEALPRNVGQDDTLGTLLQSVDMVCVTDVDRETLVGLPGLRLAPIILTLGRYT